MQGNDWAEFYLNNAYKAFLQIVIYAPASGGINAAGFRPFNSYNYCVTMALLLQAKHFLAGTYMRYILIIVVLGLLPATNSFAQTAKPRMVKFSEVQELFTAENDTVYVINFWATWCAPCVKELPYFEDARKQFADKKVRILLVNLDFKKEYENRVVPFVHRKKLKNEVWFLDESDPNNYIDKVSAQWSGAIPFTVIYNAKSGSKGGFEKTLTRQELINEINKELTRIK